MHRTPLAGLLVLAGLLALTLYDLAPPSPVSASAPPGVFSAERAFAHVEAIATTPHPTGSAEHTRVREHLVAELRALDLDVRVQEGVGVLPIEHDGSISMGTMRNIVAVRPGTDPTGRVVLAAHYDSADPAPGAADDGAGVATILEVARALPRDHRNDVVFLLTDGEEQGLLGAETFTREDPLAEGTVVVVNNEARGVRGSVQTFRTSPGAAPLISLYGATAPHPSADSSFSALLTLLPNNTDFHVFDRAGWMGFDSAFIGGGAYYHTPLDDPAHLDRGTLQQMGDNSLALVASLADTDLPALASGGEAVYFTVPGLLVRYPLELELPVAAAAAVLAGVLIWMLRRRREVTLPRVAAATGLALVPVLVTGALGFAVMPLLALFRPDYALLLTGDPYRPWLYQAALLLATLAVVLAWRVLLRRLGFAALASGAVLLVAVLGLASAAALPGGAHSLSWPALFASLGWLAFLYLTREHPAPVQAAESTGRPRERVGSSGPGNPAGSSGPGNQAGSGGPGNPAGSSGPGHQAGSGDAERSGVPAGRTGVSGRDAGRRGSIWPVVALTAGMAPAVVLLGAAALVSLDLGLAIGGVIAAPHFALMLLLLLPLIERALPALARPRAILLPAVAVAVAAVLVAAGLAVDRFDAAHPRQTYVAYAMDTATGKAVWGTRGGDGGEDAEHFFGDRGWATVPAGKAPLEAPELEIVRDETTGDRRTLTLRLTPSGTTPVVGLDVEQAGSGSPGSLAGPISVAGRDLAEGTGFAYHAPPGPLEVTLVLHPGQTRLRVFEQTPDVSSLPGYTLPRDTVNLSPAATAFRVHTL